MKCKIIEKKSKESLFRDEIKQWKETCEILANPETIKSITQSLKEFAEGKGIPLDKLTPKAKSKSEGKK